MGWGIGFILLIIFLYFQFREEESSSRLDDNSDGMSDEKREDIEEAIENGDFDEAEELMDEAEDEEYDKWSHRGGHYG